MIPRHLLPDPNTWAWKTQLHCPHYFGVGLKIFLTKNTLRALINKKIINLDKLTSTPRKNTL